MWLIVDLQQAEVYGHRPVCHPMAVHLLELLRVARLTFLLVHLVSRYHLMGLANLVLVNLVLAIQTLMNLFQM